MPPELVTPKSPSAADSKLGPPTAQAVGPSLDSDAKDSLGNLKENIIPIGPHGESLPADVMTDAEKQAAIDKTTARMDAGMSSTVTTDSAGALKGNFAVTPQGYDKHGMRIPDKVDYSKPLDEPGHVGPRGAGAPPDTYHGPK